MRNLTVQIPQPCHERWDDMQPSEQGRFCASCQKTVVDYTALSDRELIRRLNQAPNESCGRLRDDQLNRPLTLPTQAANPVRRHWFGILTLGLFGWQTAQAQDKPADKLPQPTMLAPRSPFITQPTPATVRSMRTVTGRLLLVDGNGRTSPVPAAEVHLMESSLTVTGRREFMYTRTDSAGIIRMEIPTDWSTNSLTVDIFTSDFTARNVKVNSVSPATTTSITLSDILLDEAMCVKIMSITGGGLAIIRTPSRWQRIKRKLFHRAG